MEPESHSEQESNGRSPGRMSPEPADPYLFEDDLDLEEVSFSDREDILDGMLVEDLVDEEIILTEKEEPVSLSGARKLAPDLLRGMQVDANLAAEMVKAFGGKRPDFHDELLDKISGESDVVEIDGPTATPPESIRERAQLFGTIYIYNQLLDYDPALLEELYSYQTSLRSTESESVELLKRFERFLSDEIGTSLLPLRELLRHEFRDTNTLAATQILRGVLEPYFDITSEVDRRSGWAKFWDSKYIGPDELTDLTDYEGSLGKAEVQFLEELSNARSEADKMAAVKAAELEEQKRAAEQKAQAEAVKKEHERAHPQLRKIFEIMGDAKGADTINAVDAFVSNARSLSLADLHLITQRLPRGVNWGSQNDFKNMGKSSNTRFQSCEVRGKNGGFEPADLKILLFAIRKTDNARGEEHSAKIGKQMREILSKSRAMHDDNNSKEFRQNLHNYFVSELGAMLGRVLRGK